MARRRYIMVGLLAARVAVAVTLLLILDASANCTETISRCVRVITIDSCRTMLELDDVLRLDQGTMIIVHQVHESAVHDTAAQDTTVQDTAVQDPLRVKAGTWSISNVEASAGTLLFLESPLQEDFDPDLGVQLCVVFHGGRVVIGDTILAMPLSLGAGGLIAVVADTVEITGLLDAHAAGYAGGRRSISGYDTNVVDTDVPFLTGRSGSKGLGITRTAILRESGRDPNINGGGGGNALNAGGGGGAGGSPGGTGGDQVSAYTRQQVGGLGGVIAHPRTPLLLPGGGGGGGQQNDFMGSNGAPGGGVVIIIADVIISSNGVVDVSGGDAEPSVNDGAGGGGGGGTCHVMCDTIVGTLRVVGRGGNGGDALGLFHCYGSGGGGGGGRLHVASSKLLTELSLDLSGGSHGASLGVGACETDTAYGSSDGAEGTVDVMPATTEPPWFCSDPDLIVRCLDTAASVGDVAMIPIEIEARAPLPASTTIKLRLRARATVLWPMGRHWWVGRYETFTFVDIRVPTAFVGIEQHLVPYQALLGDSASVMVRIDSAWTTTDSRVEVERNGLFTVTDVCTASETPRLFDAFGDPSPITTQSIYDVRGRALEPSITTPSKPYKVVRLEGRRIVIVP